MDMRMIITYAIVDAFCIILAISMSIHINRDCGSEFEVKSLRCALGSYCGFLVAGLVGILMENHHITYIRAAIWITNIFSLLLLLLVSYFWFMFATARLHNKFPAKWVIYFASAPVVLAVILCVTTPITAYIFTINAQGAYQRGPLFALVYLPNFIYGFIVLLQVIYVGIRKNQHEKRRELLVMGLFLVFPTIAAILQIYLANMPILAPAIITAFFLVFINIQSGQIYNDALTGLNNRRRAHYYLIEQLSSAGDKRPVTVYLMDINSFKQINDRYGHAEGDIALKTVAETLMKLCQQHHLFVARYGGDEFIMVGTWRNPEEPKVVIKALRDTLLQQCAEKGSRYDLSVAIGYALAFDARETVEQVVNRADKELYTEKHLYHDMQKNTFI